MRGLQLSGFTIALAVHFTIAPATGSVRAWPHARGHHSIFYDESKQRVMVTGGAATDSRRSYELFNDLWSFDGTGWTALESSGDRMSGATIAVDAEKRAYSFGGFRDSPIGDLRVLENDRWRLVGTHPSVVAAEPGFVFDSARSRFVVFGGGSGAGRFVADVWEYAAGQWRKHPTSAPPARGSHAMVYDARRKRTVVFGGMGIRRGESSAPLFADTWEFDGTGWTERRVAAPPPRLGAGAAYDSKRGLVMIFGGANHQAVFNDLWSWDGNSWKKLAENGPEPRVMGYIAYDAKRDRVVLFGGRRGSPDNGDLSDTWEWDGAAWRKVGLDAAFDVVVEPVRSR